MNLERKILELAQLRVLLSGTNDMSFVTGWLDFLASLYRGRNLAIEAYVEHESGFTSDPAALRVLHSQVSQRVETVITADTALRQMNERIRRQL